MVDDKSNRQRSLAWTRDEIVLVAAAVAANDWHELGTGDDRVKDLSVQLRALDIHPRELRDEKFRSLNAVSRKSADIATRHSSYQGVPTRGGDMTRKVAAAFERNPDRWALEAELVRLRAAGELGSSSDGRLDPDPNISMPEGGTVRRTVRARERDKILREQKIAAVQSATGTLSCEACTFEFERTYGLRGRGYIEVHHRVPLFVAGLTDTTLDDLALLCSNCHRMIHREKGNWLTVEQLADLVRDHSADEGNVL